jgi:MoaA/NifB/PqqE/SkfB family radical SAM enzyme
MERLFLVVTNHCNGQCPLCHYWKSRKLNHLPLSFVNETVTPFIREKKIPLTIITGGEPTLHPQLPAIIKSLKLSGTRVSLTTNGSGLNRCFEETVPHIDAYMFSMDAADPELFYQIRKLNHFHEQLKWPQKIKEKNPWAQIAFLCLIQKQNLHQLLEIYKLTAELPVDALFFNVPDLSPHSFARTHSSPGDYRKNAILSDHEIAELDRQLNQIQDLDSRHGLLFQGSDYFEKCIRYFKSIRDDDFTPLNDREPVCRVPFDSIVIDENQQIMPCFYLPHAIPFSQIESQYTGLKQMIANDTDLYPSHCSTCLQYQG